jgi:hypothetical protein
LSGVSSSRECGRLKPLPPAAHASQPEETTTTSESPGVVLHYPGKRRNRWPGFGPKRRSPPGSSSARVNATCSNRVLSKAPKIVYLTNTALSHYNALTVAVNQRMSHGLQLYIECNLWTNLFNGDGSDPARFASECGLKFSQASNRSLECGDVSFAPRRWFYSTFLYGLPLTSGRAESVLGKLLHPTNRSPRAIFESGLVSRTCQQHLPLRQ